ncbi:Pentatricopeptide repeat-containing protein [Striga hermonthica]|uniref:Pentatricopeptide repeat-containing protein n=1 Tax=Striga hermonthica TaxID=68872 RepID=A0A9N7RHY1_STRHE|nr:Pentatricopeptide repeat-containing protein [Striga hermonthica]
MMRRVRRISEFQVYLNAHSIIAKPSLPKQFNRHHVTQAPPINRNLAAMESIVSLFSSKWGHSPAEVIAREKLREYVSQLKNELLSQSEDVEKIERVLEEDGVALFRKYPDGSAVVELLTQLKSFPDLSMKVFTWRRRQLDYAAPMTAEEYTKGIIAASKLKNVDLSVELFKEALNKNLTKTSVYNALMSAYMYNGLTMRCQSLFRDLKVDPLCSPTITTYNILISAFGRLMLVDHMEATLKEISDLNIPPTLDTYKGLISGYITAWKWDKMERTYWLMKAGPVQPDLDIQLLMLRGYAHSGKIEKMEEMYEMVKAQFDGNMGPLIRSMICAYYKSSHVARVQKIDELLRIIPEDDYKPWLNVFLICLYAEEDLLERMENAISMAIQRKAYVTTARVMRCVISSYFRQNAVDRLAEFVRLAEFAGWKRCRSCYHCKMVLYANEMRIYEMEKVLDEMDRVNIPLCKKTFWILYKAYQKFNQRSKLELVAGMMCKLGYGIPMDISV